MTIWKGDKFYFGTPTIPEGMVGAQCSMFYSNCDMKLHMRIQGGGGRLLLLEHMRPGNRVLGFIFDLVNPFVVRMMGANINRMTIDNIKSAGWQIKIEQKLSSDIVRWIEAKP